MLTPFVRRWIVRALPFVAAAAAHAQVSSFVTNNPTPSGFFGGAIAGVPDLNGDGRGDVVIGAPGEGPSGTATFRGRVYVYSGSSGALIRTLLSPNAQTNGLFGDSVAGIPDVNGDGRGDIVVGAPGEDPGTTPVGAGRAYIFSGATGQLLRVLASPSNEQGGSFGDAVSGISDVNGDGRGDVVIGAPKEDPGASPDDCGRAYTYSGATGALISKLLPPTPEIDGEFGFSVAGVADVNGDGRGDVIVGAPGEDPGAAPTDCGRAYIYSGATGLRLRTLASPGQEAGGRFGEAVGGVPDVNADGRGDVVVGAPDEDPGASPLGCGRAHVYSGANGALLFKLLPPAPELDGNFGVSVAGVADINGDARGDIIVGAWKEDPGALPTSSGRVHVYSGATGLRLKTFGTPNAEVDGSFGIAVAGVPDANANARGEVAAGAPGESAIGHPNFAGRAYLFRN
ncbi:MAG: integrin alpha [Phycisphaerales bacterium]